MPRDSSGTYTLPAGNPVVSGTVITSTWANDTMDDVETALTDSLDRNGRGGMLAAFQFADGTEALPGAAWVNEPTSGLYRAGAGDLRASILTQDVVRFQESGGDGVLSVWDNTSASWHEVISASTTGQVPVDVGTVQGQVLRWDEDTDEEWQASSSLLIDDSGSVLVGGTDATVNADAADLVIGDLTGNHGVTIMANATTGTSALNFGDLYETGAGSYAGSVRYDHANDNLDLWSSGARSASLSNTVFALTVDDAAYRMRTSTTDMDMVPEPGSPDNWDFLQSTAGTFSWTTSAGVLAKLGTSGFINFTSTGIDDNATSTAITIDSSDVVNIGLYDATAASQGALTINKGANPAYIAIASQATNYTNAEWGGLVMYSADASGTGAGVKGSIRALNPVLNGSTVEWQFNVGSGSGNDTEAMRIDSSGQLGIGISSPAYLLDVDGDAAAVELNANTTAQFDENTTGADGQRGALNMRLTSGGTQGDGEYGPALTFSGINITRRRAAIASVQTDADSDLVGLAFFTHPSSSTANDTLVQQMVLDAGGRLGIGTTNPIGKLTVSNSTDADIEWYTSAFGGGTGAYVQVYDRTGAAYRELGYNASIHRWGVSGVEKMRIDSSGNVGIGTTSPSVEGLEISRNNNGTGDYATVRLTNSDGSVSTGHDCGSFEVYTGDVTDGPQIASYIRTTASNAGTSYHMTFGIKTVGASVAEVMRIRSNGVVNMSAMPTSASGLSAGDLWNDSGTVKIV